MITIFTPTYNRAHLLSRLYESLLRQSCQNFEWVVVDDGSADNTQDVIASFKSDNKISINYFKQKNGGKHRAINQGLKLAKGELFFIVDSDDYLFDKAIEIVLLKYDTIKDNSNIVGVAGRRMYENKMIVGSENFKELISNSIDIRFKHNVTGDLVEVFKTDFLKQFSFPEFEGEKFCPEALIWNRIAQKGQLLFFNVGIYITEYLEGGLTSSIVKVRRQSPNSSMLYYSELESLDIPFIQKIKANSNFWRFSFNSKTTFFQDLKKVNGMFSLIGFPVGFFMYCNDKRA